MDFSFRGQALMAIFFVAFLFYFNFRVSSLKHLGGCPRIILFFSRGLPFAFEALSFVAAAFVLQF